MTVLVYVGGSKDGTRGFMPHGLTKLQVHGKRGPEIYVERLVDLRAGGRVRVMVLEGLKDEIVLEQANRHCRR